MKVSQALKLMKDLDKDAELMVSVRVFTQAYAVAQLEVYDINRSHGGATIHVSFGEGFSVVNRNKKQTTTGIQRT